jgi:hypothetical protein
MYATFKTQRDMRVAKGRQTAAVPSITRAAVPRRPAVLLVTVESEWTHHHLHAASIDSAEPLTTDNVNKGFVFNYFL